jgi:hypothetical protein
LVKMFFFLDLLNSPLNKNFEEILVGSIIVSKMKKEVRCSSTMMHDAHILAWGVKKPQNFIFI